MSREISYVGITVNDGSLVFFGLSTRFRFGLDDPLLGGCRVDGQSRGHLERRGDVPVAQSVPEDATVVAITFAMQDCSFR